MGESNILEYTLSKKLIIILFIYYFMILISGIIYISMNIKNIILQLNKEEILFYSFWISFFISGMLCSVQYIKRLYKACITKRIDLTDDFLKRLGNFTYFVFRPIFAIVFTIVMIFALLSGMVIVTGSLDYILNNKFIYLCAIIASFLGYSIGKVLDKFGKKSNDKINNII